jgi:hypothetical protein
MRCVVSINCIVYCCILLYIVVSVMLLYVLGEGLRLISMTMSKTASSLRERNYRRSLYELQHIYITINITNI